MAKQLSNKVEHCPQCGNLKSKVNSCKSCSFKQEPVKAYVIKDLDATKLTSIKINGIVFTRSDK